MLWLRGGGKVTKSCSRLMVTKISNGPQPRTESLSRILRMQLWRLNSVLWTTNSLKLSIFLDTYESSTHCIWIHGVCLFFSQPALRVAAYKSSPICGGQHRCLWVAHTPGNNFNMSINWASWTCMSCFFSLAWDPHLQWRDMSLHFLCKKGNVLWNPPCCEKPAQFCTFYPWILYEKARK